MKLISLWQPWASLMAIRAKRIETRPWGTPYRGWLAIHAAKCWNMECQRWVCEEVFADAIEPHYGTGHANDGTWLGEMKRSLPRGRIVAVVNLVECLPTEDLVCLPGVFSDYPELDTPQERAFGNYAAGRRAWVTDQLFRLPNPIPFKGFQGIRDLDAATVELIRAQAPNLRGESR